MRKTFAVVAALVLVSGLAFAQAATQPPPAQSGMAGMQHGTAHHAMNGNMQEHMQQMKAALAEMKQNLDAMKADVAKMDNEVGKDYMQKNNELWQKMVDHLDMMMSQMGGGSQMGPFTPPSSGAPKKPATKPPQK